MVISSLLTLGLAMAACAWLPAEPGADAAHVTTQTPPRAATPTWPAGVLPATATLVPLQDQKPTPTLTGTPTLTPIVYVVQKGDILGRIALDNDVSLGALLAANGLTESHVLSIGERLIIPNESMIAAMAERGLDVQPETPTPAFPSPTPRPGAISWQEANQHVGERVIVEGLVVRSRKAGGDVFLYFRDPSPEALTLHIPVTRLRHFAAEPETHYLDRWVTAVGMIERTEAGIQMVIEQDSELNILD
ncbi:MAG: LysM peptidoglycan-binding domain-containing protein [Chloroflexi bacterium]|nr:LysM peptidoglycan-binding domain-containing protein [Chloroflexota bacterium]